MGKQTIVGFRQTSFKPQDSDNEIRGTTIFVTAPQDGVTGLAAEKIFLKVGVAEAIAPIVPGMEIKVVYNKWGKPDEVEVISRPKP